MIHQFFLPYILRIDTQSIFSKKAWAFNTLYEPPNLLSGSWLNSLLIRSLTFLSFWKDGNLGYWVLRISSYIKILFIIKNRNTDQFQLGRMVLFHIEIQRNIFLETINLQHKYNLYWINTQVQHNVEQLLQFLFFHLHLKLT